MTLYARDKALARALAAGWRPGGEIGRRYWSVWLPHAGVGVGPLVWEWAPGRWASLLLPRGEWPSEEEALSAVLEWRDVVLS